MSFEIISKYKNSMVNGDIIIEIEKEKQEMLNIIISDIKEIFNPKYDDINELKENPYYSKKINLIEKYTGKKIEEVIK